MASRKRVIYQSEALYVGATGNGAVASKLSRVQSINYGFDIPRQDVNEFGKLARIDQVILESPTVSLDYSYYITTGKNEDIIGFSVTGGVSAMTNMLNGSEDVKNYYIATVPEGIDEIAHNRNSTLLTADTQAGVIGLGNMSMTSYSVEASVGGFPTASVNCEGLNIRFENSATGTAPTVNQVNGTSVGDTYELEGDSGTTGDAATWTPSALRPGDISLVFDNNTNDTMLRGVDLSELKLQSANISVDLGREDLLRLGNKFAFSKEVDYPVTVSMSAEAMLSDTREFDLTSVICSDTGKYEAYIAINMPKCGVNPPEAIRFTIKGAQLDSESISSSIGDNKSISFNFTSQVGGPNDTDAGLFILPPQTTVTP